MATETVTLWLDEDLVAEAMQYTDDLSAFVNGALEAALRNAPPGLLLDELDAEFGPGLLPD